MNIFLFFLIIDLQIAFIYLNYCTLFCTSCFLSESGILSSYCVRSFSHFLCHSSIKLSPAISKLFLSLTWTSHFCCLFCWSSHYWPQLTENLFLKSQQIRCTVFLLVHVSIMKKTGLCSMHLVTWISSQEFTGAILCSPFHWYSPPLKWR